MELPRQLLTRVIEKAGIHKRYYFQYTITLTFKSYPITGNSSFYFFFLNESSGSCKIKKTWELVFVSKNKELLIMLVAVFVLAKRLCLNNFCFKFTVHFSARLQKSLCNVNTSHGLRAYGCRK